MDRTLFVHLGPAKTGTTAIQYFLSSNDTLLSAKGYHYIETLRWKGDGSHSPLGWILFHKHSGIYANTQSIPFVADQDTLLRDLADEIDGVSGKSIILSSEIFPFLSAEASDELLALFPSMPVKAVFYVRNLREQSLSFAAQVVRYQNTRGSDDRLSHIDVNHIVPLFRHWYVNCLQWWEEKIGKENLIFRKYGAKYFKGGNVYADILDAMGIEWTDDFVRPDNLRNESLRHSETIYFKDLLNRLPLRTSQDKLERQLLAWERSNQGTKFSLPPHIAAKVEENSLKIEEHLRRNYLDETYDGFFDDPYPLAGEKEYRLPFSDFTNIFSYVDSSIPGFKDDFIQSLAKVLDRTYEYELGLCEIEDGFESLIRDRNAVALWGCGDIAERLFRRHDFLRDRRLYVIDKNPERQGSYFWGHEVMPPSVIERAHIDTVVITTAAHTNEIRKEITEHHPGVQCIIRLTDPTVKIGIQCIELRPGDERRPLPEKPA